MSSSISYKLFSDPWNFYNAMLTDIENAKNSICIETYKFGSGSIGERFRNVLIKKAEEGVKIKLLLDSWGTSVHGHFFKDLIAAGAEIRYFKKIRFFIDFFTKNHRRNHRKLLIIDDKITYMGSANIAGHSLNWRESVLRIEGFLTKSFMNIFLEDFSLYNKYVFNKGSYIRLIRAGGFEILRDVPSITKQKIKKRYEWLIKRAKNSVFIETPYFLPGFLLRKAMINASKRGVDVNVLVPKQSDIGLIDVMRNRYLGVLYRNNVKIWYFLPCNLHAKLILIDDKTFVIGSPNFDYRSFRYQHEIALQGNDDNIRQSINDHIAETIKNSEAFDYEEWLRRPFIQKFIESIFIPFRHLF